MRTFKAPPLTEGALAEIERSKAWLAKSDLPLYAEVGCGAGYHPLSFVRNRPQSRILAFERTTEKFEKAEQRLKNHLAKSKEYERCLIVHGDATHLWSPLFPAQSLEGLFFLYPNPYPKKQQSNRRLAHMPFLDLALESLKTKGTFEFATNEKFYFDELIETIERKSQLQIEATGPVPSDLRPRSHFEKKYLERGETCFQILALRK